MPDRHEIVRNWLPRYTGMQIEEFGDYVLLTNFSYYLTKFADRFGCEVKGIGRPMQAATNSDSKSELLIPPMRGNRCSCGDSSRRPYFVFDSK